MFLHNHHIKGRGHRGKGRFASDSRRHLGALTVGFPIFYKTLCKTAKVQVLKTNQ